MTPERTCQAVPMPFDGFTPEDAAQKPRRGQPPAGLRPPGPPAWSSPGRWSAAASWPTATTACASRPSTARSGAIRREGDVYPAPDVMARQVGIPGVFFDGPATLNLYAHCTGMK
ncbi:MAG: hypothetical protein Fur0014_08910 [Rubrivivax sp.]